MDKLDAFRSIAAGASRGELSFPTNVNASLRIQQALNDPDCHLESAAKLLTAEPLIAARTVAVANSAAYSRGLEITDVRTAVMRLGFRNLQSLVAATIVRQLGNASNDSSVRAMSAALWEHTAHVAALAHAIARYVHKVDPDTAMFAALVHEIGAFYLLSRADDFPGVLEGDNGAWAEYGEKVIGRSVLKTLGVPEAVSTAVESLWFGLRALPPETLGDVLLLANDLSPVPSPLQQHADATTLDEASTLDFAMGGGTLKSILEESADEVASLTKALLQ
ncbi:MAG: hypothetical protein K0S28_1702 [Paucimonas sp.]|jgi:hypothetical protein|nr:hypothetical protein [Paucimonas sp.]